MRKVNTRELVNVIGFCLLLSIYIYDNRTEFINGIYNGLKDLGIFIR